MHQNVARRLAVGCAVCLVVSSFAVLGCARAQQPDTASSPQVQHIEEANHQAAQSYADYMKTHPNPLAQRGGQAPGAAH